jgi:FkbM family methyltransferase
MSTAATSDATPASRESVLTELRERLAINRRLRRFLLPLFRRFNPGDIRIRHHYTSHRFTLDSFRHRGYWFHGGRREQPTIRRLQSLVRRGDTVIDIGGHIGYLTLLFSYLVGPEGRVLVFEPSPTNLPYLHRNVEQIANVTIKEIALSDQEGRAELFVDDLTGQNCTLVPDYTVYRENASASGIALDLRKVSVPCATLDHVLSSELRGGSPDVIKIDAEGGEFEILSGMSKTLSAPNLVLMVEVSRRHEEVSALLRQYGFSAFNPEGEHIDVSKQAVGNVFFVKGRGL